MKDNPAKHKENLEKEAIRYKKSIKEGKLKKIDQWSERGQRHQRNQWSERKKLSRSNKRKLGKIV